MLKMVDDYIREKLVHSIHTSERRSFRGCRRRWDWIFHDGYYPVVTAKPLEFGVAYHAAKEKLYDPLTWHDQETAEALAIATFVKVCDEQFDNYQKAVKSGKVNTFVDFDEVRQDYQERKELGIGMLRYYVKNEMPKYDTNFKPVKVEIEFEVAIRGPKGELLWCKCDRCWKRYVQHEWSDGTFNIGNMIEPNSVVLESFEAYQDYSNPAITWTWEKVHQLLWKGLPVTYGGRIDMLAQDNLGRYWVFDWKELSLSMPLLTPMGWTTMGEIQVGDEVIGADGKSAKVLATSDVIEKEIWEMEFADGTIIECSDQHLWKIHSSQFGWSKVLRTDQLTTSYERYTIDPIGAPVEFSLKPDLPMHPYILGSLLGDGHFGQSQIVYASQSGETVELLRQYASEDVIFQDERKYGGNKWTIRGPWKQHLVRLELWGHLSKTKFIPKQYLFATIEERILLLQGLCDTDGNTGLFRFATCSKQLAEDFNHLVRSLGGIASISTAKARKHNNETTDNAEEYFVNYTLPEDIEPNQLVRKRIGRPKRVRKTRHRIVDVRKTDRVEPMKCIYVDAPEHLYVTKNFILTHNTTSRMTSGEPGDDDDFMWLDDQVTSYAWAMWSIGLPIAGFVYVEIKKVAPEEPEPLSRPYKGRIYSTNKTTVTSTYDQYLSTVSENDATAYLNGLYDDFLEYLKNRRFHVRHQIPRSEEELRNIGFNIWQEASDMIDPNLRIYPSAGRFTCNGCAFKDPCMMKNRDEDYQYTLDTLFDKRERHYFEQPSSTDKPGRG